MKEYICNLCGNKIHKSDIRMSFDVDIDGIKKEQVDMHSHCYYSFIAKAKAELIHTIDSKNIL